jgi:hypothetical protein
MGLDLYGPPRGAPMSYALLAHSPQRFELRLPRHLGPFGAAIGAIQLVDLRTASVLLDTRPGSGAPVASVLDAEGRQIQLGDARIESGGALWLQSEVAVRVDPSSLPVARIFDGSGNPLLLLPWVGEVEPFPGFDREPS